MCCKSPNGTLAWGPYLKTMPFVLVKKEDKFLLEPFPKISQFDFL